MYINVFDKKNNGFERYNIVCSKAYEVIAIKVESYNALINIIALIIVLYTAYYPSEHKWGCELKPNHESQSKTVLDQGRRDQIMSFHTNCLFAHKAKVRSYFSRSSDT